MTVSMRKTLEEFDGWERPATPRIIDFAEAWTVVHWRDANGKMHEGTRDDRAVSELNDARTGPPRKGQAKQGLLMTDRQLRARERRRIKREGRLTDAQFYARRKPLEEWDAEELARGRPRNRAGNFSGRAPKYITREVHERSIEMYKKYIRTKLNISADKATVLLDQIMGNEDIDEKGRPLVPASTKLDAAKFVVEHLIGKPTQPTTTEISVKLQGVLAAVMVNPEDGPKALEGYSPAHVGKRGDDDELLMEEDEDGTYS